MVSGLSYPTGFQQDVMGWEPFMTFASTVCFAVVNKSKESSLYIVDLHSDSSSVHLAQRLHEASIQTILISHHSKLTSLTATGHRKNMIFILNDFDELLSLIFYTISRQESIESDCDLFPSRGHNTTGGEHCERSILPRYCIHLDEHNLWADKGKICDKVIGITSAELEDDSVLNDSFYNATRSLYTNKIWNSKNHLIFLLRNVRQNYRVSRPKHLEHMVKRDKFTNKAFDSSETDTSSSFVFCFKFFWRLFKGQKAAICHLNDCEKYDPFTKTLTSHRGEDFETFFDFSWSSLHGKRMRVYIDDYSSTVEILIHTGWHRWDWMATTLIDSFAKSLNGSTILQNDEIKVDQLDKYWAQLEAGLKYGVDLHVFQMGIRSEKNGYSIEDFSLALDSNYLCIATPHTGFMSQALVIFKSFTTTVWVLICTTIISFSLMLYVFQNSQCELFHRLYTKAEIEHFRNSSAILIAYAFFICGSPPSLRLGHLITGKMLFLIFSFSAVIISTAFLGSMTTLLDERVQFPEIDSVETLADSNLFIQTSGDPSSTKYFFDHQIIPEKLRGKIATTFLPHVDALVFELLGINDSLIFDSNHMTNFSTEAGVDYNEVRDMISKNVQTVAKSDAFLVDLPFISVASKEAWLEQPLQEGWFEYHLMKECLMTFPITFSFLRDSFVFDKLNHFLAIHVEHGIIKKMLQDNIYTIKTPSKVVRVESSETEPRAYSVNDLQSAFIGLILGLFASFLAFVGELSSEHFQNAKFKEFVKCLKMCWFALFYRAKALRGF